MPSPSGKKWRSATLVYMLIMFHPNELRGNADRVIALTPCVIANIYTQPD